MRTCLPALLISFAFTISSGCDEPQLPPPANVNAEVTSFPGSTPAVSMASPSTTRPSRDQAATSDQEDNTHTPQPPGKAEFAGLSGPIPVTWTWEPPRHHFRVAQWIVPGREGAEPAELVVTTFPEASGNTIQNNIDRWTRQFRSTDGSPPRPTIDAKTVNELSTTMVDLEGEYLGMGGGWHKADYRMLVTIIETPDGSVFIKLLGPAETVSANADGYKTLIQNLTLKN